MQRCWQLRFGFISTSLAASSSILPLCVIGVSESLVGRIRAGWGFGSRGLGSSLNFQARPKRVALTTTVIRAGEVSVDQVLPMTKDSVHLMLVTDLDFTLVDHDDAESENQIRFNSLWAADYAHTSLLVYSSGRSPEKYKQLRKEKPLLTPDIGIFSVGTQILYGPSMDPDQGWETYLDEGWNRDLIVKECSSFPALKSQEDSEQQPHKVSFYVEKEVAPDVIRDLTERLQGLQLKAKLIYSGGCALDILPERAGKGGALGYLLEQLRTRRMSPKETLVCGDSGNDAEFYTVQGVKGVIVGNALDELLEWYNGLLSKKHIFRATERCAGGILEAIEYFHLGPSEVPADRVLQSPQKSTSHGPVVQPEAGSASREVVDFHTALVLWVNGDSPNTDEAHGRILEVTADGGTMVRPWGEELALRDSVALYRDKHGLKKDAKLQIWIDCIKQQRLADNIFLVTWQYWQQLTTGQDRKGTFATAILRTKIGHPNGLEWIRVHETSKL